MIRNIQALRAFAALLVVFVHLEPLLNSLGLKKFGGGGVDLFFVISGFVIVHATRDAPPTPAHFIVNRIARIVPLYWVMTLLVFAVALVAPSLLQTTSADPVALAKSLFFIPFTKASGVYEPVLLVGWSLNFEMFFYALFALGLMSPRYWQGVAAVGAVLVTLTVSRFVVHPSGTLLWFFTRSYVVEFGFGMAICALLDRFPAAAGLKTKSLVLAAAGLGFLLLIAGEGLSPAVPHAFVLGAPAFTIVTAAVLLERWGWSVKAPSILLLGEASYAIYLTHPFVTQTFQRTAMHLHATGVVSLLAILLTFPVVIFVGIVVHRHIEVPLVRLAKLAIAHPRFQSQPV